MSVTVYVEGGGNRAQLQAQCRKGFQKLLANAEFGGRLPRVVTCGSRNDAFHDFKIALRKRIERKDDEYPILLVDSENPVADDNQPDANPSGAWRHLSGPPDRWTRPSGAADDQAQLMMTTMETWRQTFIVYFPAMSANALPPDADLESRRKLDVADAFRKVLDFQPGDNLVAHVDDGRLVIEKADAVERRLHALFRRFEGRSLAGELIAERREEVRRESGS